MGHSGYGVDPGGDRTLAHGSKIEKPTPSLVKEEERTFRYATFQSGSGENDLWAKVWEYEVSVPLVSNSGDMDSTHVWARDRLCPGWRDTSYVNGLEDLRWAGIRDVTSTGCKMYSYFYEVFQDSTEAAFLGWHPYDPDGVGAEPMSWRYSYVYEPPSQPRRPATGDPAPLNVVTVHLAEPGPVRVGVFDVSGRRIAGWSTDVPAGAHRIEWDGRHGGSVHGRGVYLLRVEPPRGPTVTRKVVLP